MKSRYQTSLIMILAVAMTLAMHYGKCHAVIIQQYSDTRTSAAINGKDNQRNVRSTDAFAYPSTHYSSDDVSSPKDASSLTVIEKTVAPSGGDYTTITAALADITDATPYKQYRIHVEAGTYNETGPNGLGLELKDYVNLEGDGRGLVVIKGPEAPPGSESTMDTIHRPATCSISGMTIVAYRSKYPIHIDCDWLHPTDMHFTVRDCDLHHLGGNDGYYFDAGLGLYQNQHVVFENVNLLGGGIYVHGSGWGRASDTSWGLTLNAVTGNMLNVQDFMEYNQNYVTLNGSRFEKLVYTGIDRYYVSNPDDPLYNRGYYNKSITIESNGSSVGRIEYGDAFFTTETLLGGRYLVIQGTNIRCVNNGSGSVAQGQGVKLLANLGPSSSNPAEALISIVPWDGSGYFAGFAETSMAVNEERTCQYGGFPRGLVDAGSAAIAYGDALELDSRGNLVEHMLGIVRGYAWEAKASGVEVIDVRIVPLQLTPGNVTTVAGTGTNGYSGDSGVATSANLNGPSGLAIDNMRNLYIADRTNNRIRKVDAATGIITTVAGSGASGYSGDNGPATQASLNNPGGVAVDGEGNLIIADSYNNRIRRVDAVTGIITTIAGNGFGGESGDNGSANLASISLPNGIVFDNHGNLFVAETGADRVRKVDAATMIITTVAGTGYPGFSGDNGPAISAHLRNPEAVAVDRAGNLYIADEGNNRIRKIDADRGIITTVAGRDSAGYGGDNGPATQAFLDMPKGVSVDSNGNLLISDTMNCSLRQVDAVTGIITTVAGRGYCGYSGDNTPASSTLLGAVYGGAFDSEGAVYIIDYGNDVIRKFTPDRIAPTITAFAIPATINTLWVPVTTLNAVDNAGVTGYCLTETNDWSGCVWSVTMPTSYTFATSGVKVLYAWAKDAASNISTGVSARTTIDTSKPFIAFTIPGTSSSLKVHITSLTAYDDRGITGYCLTEKNSWSGCAWNDTAPTSYTFVGVPDGVATGKTLYVWVKDAADNVSGASSVTTITLPDVTKPVIRTFSTPLVSNKLTVTGVTITATDNIGVTAYYISESIAVPSPSDDRWSGAMPTSYSFASSGNKILHAFVRDAAGNISNSATTQILIDTTPPALAISTLADGMTTNDNPLNISGNVTDSGGVASLAINGSMVTVCSDGSFSHAMILSEGQNTITTTATDMAGNMTTDTRIITLDQKAPQLTITSPADNSKTNKTFINLTGSIKDSSVAHVTVKANDHDVQSAEVHGDSFTAMLDLDPGLNTITVIGTDMMENESSTKRTVVSDTTKPTLQITEPNQDIISDDSSIILDGNVADAITAINVTVGMDGATYTPSVTDNTFRQQLNFTTEKTYNILVTATDEAGNSTNAQRNIIFRRGTIVINNGAQYTASRAVHLTLGYPKAVSMQFSTDGSQWTKATLFATDRKFRLPAGDGHKTVSVRFIDALGVVSKTYSASITLDTKAPVKGELTIIPSSGEFVLNWQGFDDLGSGVDHYILTMGTKSYPRCTASPIYLGVDTQYVQSVISGTTYYFRVCAVDRVGRMSVGATAKMKAP